MQKVEKIIVKASVPQQEKTRRFVWISRTIDLCIAAACFSTFLYFFYVMCYLFLYGSNRHFEWFGYSVLSFFYVSAFIMFLHKMIMQSRLRPNPEKCSWIISSKHLSLNFNDITIMNAKWDKLQHIVWYSDIPKYISVIELKFCNATSIYLMEYLAGDILRAAEHLHCENAHILRCFLFPESKQPTKTEKIKLLAIIILWGIGLLIFWYRFLSAY